MKNFKNFIILLILLTTLIPLNTFAGKGYDLSNLGVSWYRSSGTRYCSAGKVLLDKWKGKNQNRTGSAMCYIEDNIKPSINYTGFRSGEWTQDNVDLNITINDTGSQLSKVFYKINGVIINTFDNINNNNYSFSIPTIEKEGKYIISIYAQDKAIYDSYQGAITSPNQNLTTIYVNIDKSAPVFSLPPNIIDSNTSINDWTNTKTSINFKIDDTYEGKNIQTKIFNCGTLPNNAKWNYPVEMDGTFIGTCDNSSGNNDCSNDENFTPNQSSCNYSCINDSFIKGNDGLCYNKTIKYQCSTDLLPEYLYYYNKNDVVDIEGNANGNFVWTLPNGIEADGSFMSNFDINITDYEPKVSECGYECDGGYHKEYLKCTNDTKIVCCGNPYLSYSSLGTKVDCSLAINQTLVECTYSSVCGWDKEILGLWDYNSNIWNYITDTDGELAGDSGKEQHCGYYYFEDSNGRTCDSYYYLINNNNGKPIYCDDVPNGYWSGQNNERYKCTNKKPKDSYYSSNGNNNNCEWTCDTGFIKNGDSCEDEDEDENEDECDGGNCNYLYNKNIYTDSNCSTLISINEITSPDYNKIDNCNKDLNKITFNTCIKRGKHITYYRKNILVDGCE